MAKSLSISIVGSLLLSGVALAQGPAKLTEEVKAKARANQEQAERERTRDRRIESHREYDQHRYSEQHESMKHDRDHDRHDPFRKVSEHSKGREHGRKTGWGNCDVPPGQAKKQGCHPYHNHSVHPLRTASRKPVIAPRPAAEVHAHAGVDAKVH